MSIRLSSIAALRCSSVVFCTSLVVSLHWMMRLSWAGPPVADEPELPELNEGPESVREPSSELSEAVALPPRASEGVEELEPASKSTTQSAAPPPRVDAAAEPMIRVAYGLSPDSPGTVEEEERLSQLRGSLPQGGSPLRSAAELPDGQDMARRTCRSGEYDILIGVGHLPDRAEAVLVPYDCSLGRPLGVRPGDAASDPRLLEVLWAEHEELVARGVQEKRRGLTKKARTGLIAGGAAILIAGAITAIVLGTLRTQTTVLKVEPE